jgi:hypothetical protein
MRLLHLLSAVVLPVVLLVNCQSDATAPLVGGDDHATVSVIPGLVSVDGGKALKLTAKVRHADGSYSEPVDVTWSSADGAIATVGTGGWVQALRPGRTQIVASWHENRGSSLVTVIDPLAKKSPPPCAAAGNPKGSIPLDNGCQ